MNAQTVSALTNSSRTLPTNGSLTPTCSAICRLDRAASFRSAIPLHHPLAVRACARLWATDLATLATLATCGGIYPHRDVYQEKLRELACYDR
jgi:hypothetical protein